MTPLNLLQQLQQPVGIGLNTRSPEPGSPTADTAFDAAIRQGTPPGAASEAGHDAPDLRTGLADDRAEPVPPHEELSAEGAPQPSSNKSEGAPVMGVAGFRDEPPDENAESPGHGVALPTGTHPETAVPHEARPSAPRQVAIEPVPMHSPVSPNGSGAAQSGAGNQTPGRDAGNEGPQSTMDVLDLPERPGGEARAAAAVPRSFDTSAGGIAGGRTWSPAAELARLLVPEARIGEFPEPARTPGDGTTLQVTEALGDRPGPAPGSPTEATLKSARVIDAYESLSLRLAGVSDGTEPLSSVERLTRVLASSAGPRTSYVKLQLEPPELGQLRVEVRLSHDALSIRVQAETSAAQHLLADRLDGLRAALERQGMHVERMTVELRPPWPDHNPQDASERFPGERGYAAAHDQSHSHSDDSGWTQDSEDGAPPGGGVDAESEPVEAEESGGLVTAESSVDVFV